jgi:uncharacterized Zn finger protein
MARPYTPRQYLPLECPRCGSQNTIKHLNKQQRRCLRCGNVYGKQPVKTEADTGEPN